MIRNIVFDMGNVMIRFDPDLFIAKAGITETGEARIIRNELFLSTEWISMDRGENDECDIEKTVLSRIPEHLHEKTRYLLYNWHRYADTIPGMEDITERISKHGYRILLLSNASRSQHIYWKRYTISNFFDDTFISADTGLIKPMPEIYQAFTKRFRLRPEECLFIDDSPANVEAAVMLGWDGIVFHGDSTELEKKLKDKGIL